jgi:carbon monoxide dehydrogenase subunit G
MAIEIRETFQVKAPIDAVWRFVMDPDQLVACMPGVALEEAVDDRTFVGRVKVKLGAITTSYRGRVQFTEVDREGYKVRMVAEGRETGGGTARGTMQSFLTALPDGQTEVVAEASVDLTGRVMQVGRGMIQGVSHQLFQQFVAATKERLEEARGGDGQAPVAVGQEPIRLLPLILRVLWAPLARLLRRLTGRPAGP